MPPNGRREAPLTSLTDSERRKLRQALIIGVDTHKDIQAAVAISGFGARLGATTI